MTSVLGHFLSIFFLLGVLVVVAYAWQRFNEPSFPNQENLPRTLVPLRYLFLGPAYHRARFAYVVASLLLYCVLVWPGPSIVPALGIVGVKDFPADGWALLVALFLVGVVPNSNMKWLTFVEDALRRWVHAWFLVPDGIVRTIGVLEDAPYEPPLSQVNAVPSPLREKLRDGLKLPTISLQYRWARAQMLMASLKQMGTPAHPLKRAAFEPFQEDFEAIRKNYRLLEKEVDSLGGEGKNKEAEENLTGTVDNLLKQIYRYISWGVRHQVDSELQVDQKLQELGFLVPERQGRSLFDIVAPPVVLIAAITMAFWLLVDFVVGLIPTMSQSVVYALSAGIAASWMYGSAIFIALDRRAAQIEQKLWREGSPKCLIPIAVRAGLVSWAVIVLTTVLWQLPDVWRSLSVLAQLVKSLAVAGAADDTTPAEWSTLPKMIAVALPWSIAGATASLLLAKMVGSHVRQMARSQRVRDALVLGVGLGLAAALAQLIQTSLSEFVLGQGAPSFRLVPIVGLAGLVCGAVIGFVVPYACRANLVTPPDLNMAKALRSLTDRAEKIMGARAAAESWVFMSRVEFGGITPAEAVQYKGHATGVVRLLESEAPHQGDQGRPESGLTLVPPVLEGGPGAGSHAA